MKRGFDRFLNFRFLYAGVYRTLFQTRLRQGAQLTLTDVPSNKTAARFASSFEIQITQRSFFKR